MSDIILHHYWQSPVSEKVRVVLGMKNAAWRSVEIPRLPPKPLLMPLTGGFRLTPVMQIGADIYCDSAAIIREIDRRHPEPTLYPGGAQGLPWAVAEWTGGLLFRRVIEVVFGDNRDSMPEGFWADRAALYFGDGHDADAIQSGMAEALTEIRAQFGYIDARVSGGRDFMLGAEAGLPDALCYYLVWFLRGRYSQGPEFLSQFPALEAWEQRMQAFGHGTPTDLDAEAALDIAQAAEPTVPEAEDPLDPAGLRVGQAVEVISGAGGAVVAGTVLSVSRDLLTIRRRDERVGEVSVTFPRIGYAVRQV